MRFKALASRPDHDVLRPFPAANEQTHGLGTVLFGELSLLYLDRRGLGVGLGQNHIALLYAGACGSFSSGVYMHTASQFQLFLLRVGEVTDGQT